MLLRSKLPLPLIRLTLASAVLAITVLALMPASNVPMTTSWDKLDHGLAFFTLALLSEPAFPRQPFWRRIALALVAFGVGIEIAQWFTPDRDAAVMDVVADSIGIASYGAVRWLSKPGGLGRSPTPGEQLPWQRRPVGSPS